MKKHFRSSTLTFISLVLLTIFSCKQLPVNSLVKTMSICSNGFCDVFSYGYDTSGNLILSVDKNDGFIDSTRYKYTKDTVSGRETRSNNDRMYPRELMFVLNNHGLTERAGNSSFFYDKDGFKILEVSSTGDSTTFLYSNGDCISVSRQVDGRSQMIETKEYEDIGECRNFGKKFLGKNSRHLVKKEIPVKGDTFIHTYDFDSQSRVKREVITRGYEDTVYATSFEYM